MDTSTIIEVRGGVCGTLWMPPVTGWREVRARYTLRGPDAPFAPRVESIREALERTAADDGDFQTAGKLTGDTSFTVERRDGRRCIRRTYCVTDFPIALTEIVDADVFSYDGNDEDF